MTMLETAVLIAKEAFRDKTDKAGRPYIEHLERVHDAVNEKWPRAEELRCIALLHDLLEDCPEWNEKALKCFFTERIVSGVIALTHKKSDSYSQYIGQVMENSDAKLVKIFDLKDNMDITRIPELTTKDMERLYKYHQAYKRLTE